MAKWSRLVKVLWADQWISIRVGSKTLVGFSRMAPYCMFHKIFRDTGQARQDSLMEIQTLKQIPRHFAALAATRTLNIRFPAAGVVLAEEPDDPSAFATRESPAITLDDCGTVVANPLRLHTN